MTLKNAVLVIALLTVVLPVVSIGFIADRFLFQDLRNDIFRQNRNLAAVVADEVTTHLAAQLRILKQLAVQLDEHPFLQRSGNLDLILDAEAAADEFFESVMLLDHGGKVTHVGYKKPSPMDRENYIGLDYSRQEFYRSARKDNGVHWSNTFISPMSGEPTVSVSVPIRSGLLVGNVNLRNLTSVTKQLDGKSFSYAYIVNQAGTVIAHPDEQVVRQQLNISNLSIIRDGLAGRFGTYRYTFLGQEREGAAVKIPETGWLVVVAHSVDSAYAPVKNAEKIFIIGLITVLIIFVIVAISSLNRILTPLNRLMVNARKLAGGDYSLVPISGGFQEIDALSSTFVQMAEAINRREEELMERNEELSSIEEELRQQIDEYLQSQEEISRNHREITRLNEELEARVAERTMQLENLNKKLEGEIETRRVAQQEVVLLNENLLSRSVAVEAANKELESFCYSVSHDLRAPLRHINGFSRALLEDCLESLDEQGQNYLRRICAATDRMGLLIDDLLELSRVSRNEMKHEQVNLGDIANSVIEMFKETAPERNASFKSVANIIVTGDKNLLRVVMENLLGNAWKYTSKNDEAFIEFNTMNNDGEQVFFVRDNGVGFDMNYAAKLFGAFQRLHSDADFEGTGVGLATVQRIIHRHGGRVWGEGKPGKGATFYFTLPDAPPIP